MKEGSGLRKKELLRPVVGLVICVALMLSLVVMPALAQEDYPCNFYGTAAVEGEPVAAGTEITAWAGGEQIGSAPTGEGTLADDEFSMGALYDEQHGYVVNFKTGDLSADETAQRERYGNVRVDSTASSQPVTLDLVEGVNIMAYPGATVALAEALANIGPGGLDVARIIWARAAWTTGDWWFYNVAQDYAWPAQFTQLEKGRAYLIVVSENCSWELP